MDFSLSIYITTVGIMFILVCINFVLGDIKKACEQIADNLEDKDE
jgi:hypothetical protein